MTPWEIRKNGFNAYFTRRSHDTQRHSRIQVLAVFIPAKFPSLICVVIMSRFWCRTWSARKYIVLSPPLACKLSRCYRHHMRKWLLFYSNSSYHEQELTYSFFHEIRFLTKSWTQSLTSWSSPASKRSQNFLDNKQYLLMNTKYRSNEITYKQLTSHEQNNLSFTQSCMNTWLATRTIQHFHPR